MSSTAHPATSPAHLAALRTRSFRWAWLLALLALPVILASLFNDIGAFAYDAASEHIYRGVAFSSVINDGVLYPRWSQVLHWGLGSPLFTFQPPLPYYAMDLLSRLGISHPVGWRLLIASGFALAFLGAYLLVKELSGRRWAALTAGVAYLYAPYVLRNALERGSNEAFSMLLYPLVLWSLLRLGRTPSYGRFLLAVVIWAACIGSHVLGPLMLIPFALLAASWAFWRYRSAAPLAALVAGGLLTAFIWAPMSLPAGGEQQWVHVERDFTQVEAIPADNPVPLDQLLAPPAVFDVQRDNNHVGDRVGLVNTLLLLAGIPVAIYAWRRNRPVAIALIVALAAGLGLLFMFTPGSDWVWRLGGSLLAKLLYRTRLMGAQALAAATVAGLIVAALPGRWQRWTAIALSAVLVLVATPSLYVELQHRYADFQLPVDLAQVREAEIKTGGSALTAFGEFTPLARTAPFDDKTLTELGRDFNAAQAPLASGDVVLRSANVRNQAWDLGVTASAPTTATLHLLYYPRWVATVDGKPVPLGYQEGTGYVQVSVPAGDHAVSLRYATTPAEKGGLILSAIMLVGLIGAGAWFAAMRARRHGAAIEAGQAAPATETPDDSGREASIPVWSLVAITALLALKVLVLDPHTTLFRCASTDAHVCGAQVTTNAAFANAPRLRGYSVRSYDVKSGGELLLDLYWEGIEGSPTTLASFVHVRPSQEGQMANPHSENGMWAQAEKVAPGGLLTKEFQAGKLYQDSYRVKLPGDIPPGKYFLETGWFDPNTGEQVDITKDAISPDLRVLWRSVLLPDINVQP